MVICRSRYPKQKGIAPDNVAQVHDCFHSVKRSELVHSDSNAGGRLLTPLECDLSFLTLKTLSRQSECGVLLVGLTSVVL